MDRTIPWFIIQYYFRITFLLMDFLLIIFPWWCHYQKKFYKSRAIDNNSRWEKKINHHRRHNPRIHLRNLRRHSQLPHRLLLHHNHHFLHYNHHLQCLRYYRSQHQRRRYHHSQSLLQPHIDRLESSRFFQMSWVPIVHVDEHVVFYK